MADDKKPLPGTPDLKEVPLPNISVFSNCVGVRSFDGATSLHFMEVGLDGKMRTVSNVVLSDKVAQLVLMSLCRELSIPILEDGKNETVTPPGGGKVN